MEYNAGDMAHLSLSLLGALTVTLDGTPVAGFEYNKVRALLIYLAVESDRAHHREVLAELLWPGRPGETARANLRKTLSTLRQAIGDAALGADATPPFFLTDRETVQFNLVSDHALDVATFMSLLDACRAHSHPRLEDCPACLARLAQAVDLYHGDFLNQFFLNDSPAFDDWARSQREALRRWMLGALTQLATAYENQRDYGTAARYAQRQIELEPWAESAHRQLMRLYAALGQRSAALAQYEACRRALADELGVEPETDTTALHEQIRQARSETPSPVAAPTPASKRGGGNPFAMRAMLKDPAAFVGRQAEVQRLFSRLASQQSCSIVGPRRIGKSSLLYYLTHPEVYRQHLPDPEAYIFAFIDLQELAGAGPEDFFRLAIERLRRASERAGGGRLPREPESGHTLSGFRRLLDEATEQGLKLVLCCDEFETLSASPGFAADFFASLRGLSSNYNLALVTASHASLFELCHQGRIQTSHFWNVFSEHRLGLMPETEAHELIRHSAFTPEDQAFILRLAGPHPFFLSIASYHVLEARPAGLSPDYAIVEERFFDEAWRHYVYTWSRLNLADQQALAQLAQGEKQVFNDQRFQFLKDNTLLGGQAKSPALASTGWQRFIREQVVRE